MVCTLGWAGWRNKNTLCDIYCSFAPVRPAESWSVESAARERSVKWELMALNTGSSPYRAEQVKSGSMSSSSSWTMLSYVDIRCSVDGILSSVVGEKNKLTANSEWQLAAAASAAGTMTGDIYCCGRIRFGTNFVGIYWQCKETP